MAGVVSGILLLVFAAIVVEGWLEQRETKRWLPIAALTYRALANEARDVRVRLGTYVNGPTSSWWPADQWVDAVQPILDANETALVGRTSIAERIEVIGRDQVWRSLAWQGVRYAKRLEWDLVAKWAPAAASNQQLVLALGELTTLNDHLARLQMLLDDTQGRSDVMVIAAQWEDLVAETHRIEHSLIRQAADLSTESVARDVHDAQRRGRSGST